MTERVIKEDLNKLILFALKTRNERNLTKNKQNGGRNPDKELSAKLENYLVSSGFMLRLSLLDSSGKVIAEASDPIKKTEGINELKKLIFEILNS